MEIFPILTISQQDKLDPQYDKFVAHVGEDSLPLYDFGDNILTIPLAHNIYSPHLFRTISSLTAQTTSNLSFFSCIPTFLQ